MVSLKSLEYFEIVIRSLINCTFDKMENEGKEEIMHELFGYLCKFKGVLNVGRKLDNFKVEVEWLFRTAWNSAIYVLKNSLFVSLALKYFELVLEILELVDQKVTVHQEIYQRCLLACGYLCVKLCTSGENVDLNIKKALEVFGKVGEISDDIAAFYFEIHCIQGKFDELVEIIKGEQERSVKYHRKVTNIMLGRFSTPENCIYCITSIEIGSQKLSSKHPEEWRKYQ
jgi:hypothetical protein